MEHLGRKAVSTFNTPPTLWTMYADDTFRISDKVNEIHQHLNNMSHSLLTKGFQRTFFENFNKKSVSSRHALFTSFACLPYVCGTSDKSKRTYAKEVIVKVSNEIPFNCWHISSA